MFIFQVTYCPSFRILTVSYFSYEPSCIDVRSLTVVFLFAVGGRWIWYGVKLRNPGRSEHQAHAGTTGPLSPQLAGECVHARLYVTASERGERCHEHSMFEDSARIDIKSYMSEAVARPGDCRLVAAVSTSCTMLDYFYHNFRIVLLVLVTSWTCLMWLDSQAPWRHFVFEILIANLDIF